MSKSLLTCSNADELIRLVTARFNVKETREPTIIQKQMVIADGVFMNIYRNGTINFQGKDPTGNTVPALKGVVEEVNAM